MIKVVFEKMSANPLDGVKWIPQESGNLTLEAEIRFCRIMKPVIHNLRQQTGQIP